MIPMTVTVASFLSLAFEIQQSDSPPPEKNSPSNAVLLKHFDPAELLDRDKVKSLHLC